MKTWFTCLLAAALVAASGQTKLKVYFVSHNEDVAVYDVNFNNYIGARMGLVNFVNMAQSKGAAYNHGTDHVFPRAVVLWDSGMVVSNTNGKNIMRWMVEYKGVECDPHAYENT